MYIFISNCNNIKCYVSSSHLCIVDRKKLITNTIAKNNNNCQPSMDAPILNDIWSLFIEFCSSKLVISINCSHMHD
jgi:hypothetical protein